MNKLIFLGLALLILIAIMIVLIIIMVKYHKRISPFLILNTSPIRLDLKKPYVTIDKNCRRLEQSLSLGKAIELSTKDNFKGDEPNSNPGRHIIASKKDVEAFFRETHYTEFETKTNDKMLNQLKKIEKSGIISVELKKGDNGMKIKPTNETQILAKLMLMGVLTTIKNIFNKKYWKYIQREEVVGEYIIKIVKEKRTL